mmetsp:Transcript_83215/g.147016  ORF Transcript_83215/g.147016 Transcript_83215/m.147016 type:complete len:1458 (-) Transcript_83215:32-4405(-)
MAAANASGRSTSTAEAESVVGEQLCHAELESQSWRLRCFQAEAQLRLLRLKRRGEHHARWPQGRIAREQLLETRASLEAANPSSGSREALQSLVTARSAVGQLQDQLQHCSNELSRLREETVEQHDLATRLTEGQAAEDASFLERELQLAREKEEVKLFAEQLRQKFARENELAERLALDQDACELLRTELEDGQPALQQLQEEAKQARTESDRARSAAQRRREAVGKLEEEVEQADRNAEEEHQALQRRLEDCHTELKDVIDNTVEIGEQTRKAHILHGRQLKAVKEGGTALRGAIQNFGQESEDIRAELERLRFVVSSAAAADAERREREQIAQESLEALNVEVNDAQQALKQAQEAYEEANGKEAEAVKAAVLEATSALKKAEQVASTAAADETEASELLQALQKEKARLRGETGPEAAQRRADEAEALKAESARLANEIEDIKAQLNTAQEKLDHQRQKREAQQYARQAAKEAAAGIRGAYASLQRRPPGAARASTSSPDGFPAVGKAVKKLGQNLDDFTRFIEEAMSLSEAIPSAGEPLDAIVNLKLPVALTQAYLGQFTQTVAGKSQAQLLAAEREKLKALIQQMSDSNNSHVSECSRLSKRTAELHSAIAECGKRQEEDNQKMEEARAQLESDVTKAGFKRTQDQMFAVSQVQEELAEHELELAKLRQERQDLQVEVSKGKGSQAPSPTAAKRVIGDGASLEVQLRQKDAELQEQRRRLAGARERYSGLLAEAGGKEAVEELGLSLPASTSPEQQTSRSRSPGRASSSGALSPHAAPSSLSPRQGEDQPSPAQPAATSSVLSLAATPDAPAAGTAVTAIPASPVPLSPGKIQQAHAQPQYGAQKSPRPQEQQQQQQAPQQQQQQPTQLQQSSSPPQPLSASESYLANPSFQEASSCSAPPPQASSAASAVMPGSPCLLIRAPSSVGEGGGGADDSSPGSSMSKRTRRSSAWEAAAMAAGQVGASPTRRAAAAMAASAAAIANAPTPPTPTHGSVVYAAQAAVAAAIATVRPGGKAPGKSGNSLSEEILRDLIEAGVTAASGTGDKVKPDDSEVSRPETSPVEGVHLPSTPPQRPGTRAALSMSWSELEGAALEPSPNSSDRLGGSDLASPSKLSAALAEIREADVEASEDPFFVDGIQASEPSPLSDRRSEFALADPSGFGHSQASSPWSIHRDAPVAQPPTPGAQALLSPRILLPCQARPMACGFVSPPRHSSPSLLQPVRAMPAALQQQASNLLGRSSLQGGLVLHPQGFIQAIPNTGPLARSCGMQLEIGSSRSRSPSPVLNHALRPGMSWSVIANDALSPTHDAGKVSFERLLTETSSASSATTGTGTWDRQPLSPSAKLQPAPSWARKALEPGGQALLMPPPTLPPLEELFELNLQEQAEERRLRQQQQERKLRSRSPRSPRSTTTDSSQEDRPLGFSSQLGSDGTIDPSPNSRAYSSPRSLVHL